MLEQTFTTFLQEHGFKASEADNALFIGYIDDCIVYLMLFVDDGLIVCKNVSVIKNIIKSMSDRFKITVIEPEVFVGMQIVRVRSERKIYIHQEKYVLRILERFKMNECKSVCIPIVSGTNLVSSVSDKNSSYNMPFAIGSLMFLGTVFRPDIVYAINYLSRFLANYDQSH